MLKRWQDSPITRHYDFSNKRLWSKQEEVLWSVRKNKRTVVKSGNTIGKSFIAADVVMDWLSTHTEAKVITTAPTFCYDDKTEILTEFGWKLFKDLKNEKVAILRNKELIFEQPEWKYEFEYSGKLIGYKSQVCDFLATPNHRIVLKNIWENGRIEIKQSHEINKKYSKKYTFTKECDWNGKDILSNEWFEFLGFWFAEGCARYNREKRRAEVTITQIKYVDYAKNLLDKLNLKYYTYKRKLGGYNFSIYNRKLAVRFSKYGKANTKKIPRWIKEASSERLEKFLYGFAKGDGSFDNHGRICRLFTSSKVLADDLQEICIKLNLCANIVKRESNGCICYTVGVWQNRGLNPSISKKYWYEKDYNGKVYCVKVSSGIVMVRRNGVNIWCGNTQVEEILWKEIRSYCFQSKIPIGVEPLNVQLKFNDNLFALGISTNETGRMQGFHSPHLLVVLDEASGISAEIWDTVEALHPERVLAIGNPLEASGRFYDCFQSSQWNKITISCEEAVVWQEANGNVPGLVTRDWIEDQKINYGTQSPWYKIHVLGEFPVEGEKTLISRKWVEDARKRVNNGKVDHLGNETAEDVEDEDERVVAADIATRHGENKTVVGYRYGHTILQLTGYSRISLHETSNKLAVLYNKKNTQPPVIDGDGVGEGMDEILDNISLPHITFHGGTASKAMDDQKFKNLRAQFYWIVARKFEKGLYSLASLPEEEYETLKNQLCAIHTKDRDPMGRFRIESKEDMQARGIKSPDHADCFVMLEFGAWMSKYSDIQPYKYK